jgi:hypothetical protein
MRRKTQKYRAERGETAAYLNLPCGSDAEATSWEPMWLNGTIENDSPASGVCSELLHSYHCFLFFCHCHKQEIESLYATATRGKKSTGHRSAKDGTYGI